MSEMVMPCLQKRRLLLAYLSQDRLDLMAPQIDRSHQGHRVQPELRLGAAPLDVHMRWLTAIAAPEEEPVPFPSELTSACNHDIGHVARQTGGAVTGCFLAVHVAGDGGHTVSGLTASAADRGVFIESDGNRVFDSQILRALGDAAVQVDGSDNLLRGNTVANAGDQGFEINGSDNRIARNRIGGVAEGVQLLGERNRVLRNEIVGATDRGIDVRGLVEPPEVTGAHVIIDNLIADGVDGIALLEDSNGNLISRNTIYSNSDQGIFVGTSDNTIERNQVLLNLVDLQDNTIDCDDNLWRDNIFETSVSDDCVE
jgi:parallel beta-helix repeat protein